MSVEAKVNYIELPARDLELVKEFFTDVFGWKFTDYGPEYTAFYAAEAGLDGGFYLADATSVSENGAALIVFYAPDLKPVIAKIVDAGGKICRDIFSFPGGQRFHFMDPCGNEYAVWSDPADA